MDATFIVNPAAGAAGSQSAEADLRRVARSCGIGAEVYRTERPGHATDLARAAVDRGATLVVAVGGDGTANEVASGLIGTGATFAVVPAGTGNDLAAELGMPKSWRAAVAALAGAPARAIDACWLTTLATGARHPFFQAAGAGLDGHVNRLRSRQSQLRGPLAYTAASVRGVLTYAPAEVTFTLDGEAWTQRALSITVANGCRYGGGMRAAPRARNDDGLFDLAVAGDFGKLEALCVFPLVYVGAHVYHPKFLLRRGRRLTVTAERPLLAHVDGTLVGETPVEFTIQPGALRALSLR